jgi:anti-anti-sigma factor
MEEQDYSVLLEEHGEKVILRLVGYKKIDLNNVYEISVVFNDLKSRGISEIAIDLSAIDYVDSSGLGCLAHAANDLRKLKKKLNILSPSKGVNHLFLMGGFDSFFTIYTDQNMFLERKTT